MILSPDKLMQHALKLARKAATLGEVPVGALIEKDGIIIAESHNLVESLHDASAHAEMLVIKEASKKLNNWRLDGCTLCVTLEPCTMCIGAIRLSRVSNLILGAPDPRAGAVGSLYDLAEDSRLGANPRVIRDIQADSCTQLLKDFFKGKR